MHAARVSVTSCQQLPEPSRRAAAGGGQCPRADRPPDFRVFGKSPMAPHHDKALPHGEARLVNALGSRRDESRERARRVPRPRNEGMASPAARPSTRCKGSQGARREEPSSGCRYGRRIPGGSEVSRRVGWRFQVALVLAHETGHRSGALRGPRSGSSSATGGRLVFGPISGRDDLPLHRREPVGRGGPAADSSPETDALDPPRPDPEDRCRSAGGRILEHGILILDAVGLVHHRPGRQLVACVWAGRRRRP